ncbi:MAG: iron ABC transporter permease, partial [Desulfatitalea sp.]
MRRTIIIPVLLVVLGLTAIVSLSLGRYPVTLGDLAGFFGLPLADGPARADRELQIVKSILVDIRLPRIAAAILIGAALSVAGAVFQSMFINPLVSPGLLGVLAGASFGAAVGMLLARSWFVVQLSAFSFGLIAVSAAVGLSALHRADRLLMLILGGIVSGTLFTSLLSVVKYLADPYEQLPAIVYWLMGGLSAVDRVTVLAASVPIVIGILILLLLSSYLNALSMGDEEARALGVHVRCLRLLFIFLATVISALTVVMGGVIGWVGLLIPHIARMLVGPDNRMLLPACALLGATYLLIADNIARLAFAAEIPIGILTSLIGIPFFA